MKKTMSRIISALLVVAMVCAMIPAAMAAETAAISVTADGAAVAAQQVITVKVGQSVNFKADGVANCHWIREDADKAYATIARAEGAENSLQMVLTGKKVGQFDLYACLKNEDESLDHSVSSPVFTVRVVDEITAVSNPAEGTYTIAKTASGYDFTNIANVKASGTAASGAVALEVDWTSVEDLGSNGIFAKGTAVAPEGYSFKTGLDKKVSLKVTVEEAPVITYTNPTKTVNVKKDATAKLEVKNVACEGATISYQWKKNGTAIAGATTAAYDVPAADTATEGDTIKYTLVITAVKGDVSVTEEITFTVNVAKAMELVLSVDDKNLEVGDDATLKVTLKKDGETYKATTNTKVTFKLVNTNDKGDTNITTTGKVATMAKNKSTASYTLIAYAKNTSGVEIVATMVYGEETLESNVISVKITNDEDDEYDDDYIIEYDVEADDEFTLDAADFEDVLNEEYRSDDLDYVKFDINDATKYGSTYGEMYESSKSNADEVGTGKYYYDDIEDIEFRIGSKSTKYTIKVPFAVYGDSTSHKVEGALYVYVNGGGSDTGAGDVNYYVDAKDEVSFDAGDFEEYLQDEYDDDDLEYVKFDIDEATKYSSTYGEIYESSKSNADEIDDGKYDYDEVDDMEFRAGSKTQEYIVKVPFIAYGEGTHKVNGDLYIYVNYDEYENETDGKGTVSAKGETLKSIGVVNFLKPTSNSTTLRKYSVKFSVTGGTLYIEKDGKKATSSTEFLFDSTKSSFNNIEEAFLVPNSNASKVTLKYTLYYNDEKEENGTITLTVSDTSNTTFTDIPADIAAWASEGINYLYEEGIINGTGGTKFSPKANMTRADFVVMLYRVAGEPSVAGIKNPFTDVVSGKYYYNAVLWANANGIVNGKDTNKFAPNDNITRQQIAAILYRYAGSPATTGTLNAFSDKGVADPYAQTALKWAVAEGIVNGSNGMLMPKANATRAQVAVMLYRYIVK